MQTIQPNSKNMMKYKKIREKITGAEVLGNFRPGDVVTPPQVTASSKSDDCKPTISRMDPRSGKGGATGKKPKIISEITNPYHP